MATLEWDSATTYPVASIVSYGGLLWEAIQVSTNETPVRGSPYWGIVGIGSALGVSSVSGSGPGLAVSGVTTVTVQNTGVVDVVAGTGITVTDLSGVYTVTPTNAPTYTAGTGITFVGTTIDNNLAGLNTPNPATVSISADASSNYTVGFTSNSPYTAGAGIGIASNVATNTGVITLTAGGGFTNTGSATVPAFTYTYPRASGGLVVNNAQLARITNPGSNNWFSVTNQNIGQGSAIWSTTAAIQLNYIFDIYAASGAVGSTNFNIGVRAGGNLSAASGLPAFQWAEQSHTDLNTRYSFNVWFNILTVSFTLINGIHYNVGGLADTFLTLEGYANYLPSQDLYWNWTYPGATIQLLGLF